MKATIVSSVLSILIHLVTPVGAMACMCTWSGPFLEMAPQTDLVIRGRVLDYHGESQGLKLSMDVQVLEVLRGRAQAEQVRIWGDDGSQCRPYVTDFPLQTEWIFAVKKITEGPHRGDFFISICGEYWLKVEGNEAVGWISSPRVTAEKESLSLAELKTKLNGS